MQRDDEESEDDADYAPDAGGGSDAGSSSDSGGEDEDSEDSAKKKSKKKSGAGSAPKKATQKKVSDVHTLRRASLGVCCTHLQLQFPSNLGTKTQSEEFSASTPFMNGTSRTHFSNVMTRGLVV